jgi:hypothetical protein
MDESAAIVDLDGGPALCTAPLDKGHFSLQ